MPLNSPHSPQCGYPRAEKRFRGDGLDGLDSPHMSQTSINGGENADVTYRIRKLVILTNYTCNPPRKASAWVFELPTVRAARLVVEFVTFGIHNDEAKTGRAAYSAVSNPPIFSAMQRANSEDQTKANF